METVKTTENYTIYKKRNGRFFIQGKGRKTINGEEKTKILAAEGLIKIAVKTAKPAEKEESTEASAEA